MQEVNGAGLGLGAPAGVLSPTTPQVQQPPPEVQEFSQILNELLVAVHEVVYTANLLEDSLVKAHPELQDLVNATKKLGRAMWRFQKLSRVIVSR